MDKIGIKLANGEFYPVLDAGAPAKKSLVLTTVNDGQKSVQIDLYRGEGPTVLDMDYVGSLVVEDIPLAPSGEPDIRLEIALDEMGILKASTRNPGSGEEQSLDVAIEALGEERKYDIPDFDLEEERTDTLPNEATSPEEGAGLLAAASRVREDRERRKVPWILLLAVLAVAVIVLLAWLLWPKGQAAVKAPEGKPAVTSPAPAVTSPAPAVTSPAPAAKAATPAPAPTPAPAAAAPAPVAKATTQPAPAPAASAPKATAKDTRYRIKWGDTLWDLAYVYYRDPWLYPRISKYNKIKNPDYILAGTTILIPPR
jgi:nucleoid-associated protein YgaU